MIALQPLQILICLLAVQSGRGYTTSAAPNRKSAFLLPRIVQSKPDTLSPQPQKYDLGLGKNAPLISDTTSRVYRSSSDVQVASKFWSSNEPPAGLVFPSPLSKEEITSVKHQSREQKLLPKPKRTSIPLHPRRQSKEELDITGDCDKRLMTPIQSVTALDLNTPWVEMLLHHEHTKLVHAAQGC